MLERLFALETFGIKLGLANITALSAALGHPERTFASIHVAGTNGKGSATAMVHAALQAAGIRAARYTSPHLVTLNERFMIGGAFVSDADLEDVATVVLDCADELQKIGVLAAPPTFFEATTAIAFELFRRSGVEVAVLEVGLGGRFDATNVVTPVVTAITSIGLDHQQHLGDTIEQIAFEKAGIIKPGVAVVAGVLPAQAREVIRTVATERDARIAWAAEDVVLTSNVDEGRPVLEIRTAAGHYGPLKLALRGDHQVGNALVAVRVLEEAQATGMPLTGAAIEHGLAHVEWPGRLEMLALPDGRRLLLDAAHNADGATALASYLSRWHPERPPLVFAAMRDKDVSAVLRVLLPVVGTLVVTAPSTRRAAAPEGLADVARSIAPTHPIAVEADPTRAVERAWRDARTVCVAGSIFLVGAVRDAVSARAIVDSSP